MRMKRILAIGWTFAVWSMGFAVARADTSLWYEKPATNWNEALPVGNGRLGAMVFGGVAKSASNSTRKACGRVARRGLARGFRKHLAEVRRLVFAGKNAEAQAYGIKHLTAFPTSFRSYEPLGDLFLDFGETATFNGYRRELHLADGLARVIYRRAMRPSPARCSFPQPDDVMAIRSDHRQPGTLDFKLSPGAQRHGEITAGKLRWSARSSM